ncbi:MAG TPA: N-acetylmuramic acid 6-phosphate etherase [Pyrinomonadaceae bacterium]|nr:N-acetylmuramic acid 6-phosphate etherase [Pyrinomonadaceae bacterium]
MSETDHELILGVEGGGSKTDWILVRNAKESPRIVESGKLPAGNFILLGERELRDLLSQLPGNVQSVGVFLAGCKTEGDRARLRAICESVWPNTNIAVGSDRDSGFAAAFGDKDGIAVISGSGSAITGRKDGKIEKAGGSGHLLGDGGGGYTLALEALRQVLRTYDLAHTVTRSAQEILRALMLNRMEDLIEWTQTADKTAVASLSPVVFTAAELGSKEMMSVLRAGAESLAKYTASVAKWLDFERPDVRLQGGIFLNQPLYVELYREALDSILQTSSVDPCDTLGAIGAAHLAASETAPFDVKEVYVPPDQQGIEELGRATTEQINPRSLGIDRMSSVEMVDLFVAEEDQIARAIASQRPEIANAIDLVATAFQNDGRLFYIGAGTSGRLGTLDASEIPPTFGEPPHRVQAIIAGGVNALHSSVEGAEDNVGQGKLAVTERGVTANDVVCGITASGRTPFVLAGLRQAKEIGAKTILLTCNPDRSGKGDFDVEIDLPTGPELITGSTRLKAGTATKVTLNMLSTCALVLAGRTKGNLMVGMRATNSKLRNRAISMVCRLNNVSSKEAEEQLRKAKWNISVALNDRSHE